MATDFLTHDRRDPGSREQLLCRIRAEFEEMTELRLTSAQARRLFGLREDVCHRVLATLVRESLLYQGRDGRFAMRSSDR